MGNKGNLRKICNMLEYKRPHGSASEFDFIRRFIDVVPGMQRDSFGNRYVRLPSRDGTRSQVMWSAHTDTVHRADGKQTVDVDRYGYMTVPTDSGSNCLGADDGAGCYILLSMIYAGVPGLYIFHRGEEVGGLGSDHIATNTPDLLDGINYAIAFDRKLYKSVITYQAGYRCCSDMFVKDLANMLAPSLEFETDDGGTFTDTENYTELVSECTNISVGYERQHSPLEVLDTSYMFKVTDCFINLFDETRLTAYNIPGDGKYDCQYTRDYHGRWTDGLWGSYSNYTARYTETEQGNKYLAPDRQDVEDSAQSELNFAFGVESLTELIKSHPAEVAVFLDEHGFSADEIELEIHMIRQLVEE
jgi:hypothetical protein